MGDLHSVAYTASLGWDFHNLEVLNADMALAMEMEGSCGSFFSSFDHSDLSTGYLEDALVEFSEQSKRRRLMHAHDLAKMYENSDVKWDMSENYDCINQSPTFGNQLSDGSRSSFSSEEENMMTEMKTPEALDYNSSSSSYKEKSSAIADKHCMTSPGDDEGVEDDQKRNKKRVVIKKRVVYPFALVKPGGREGDVTLNDINERILMRPSRPVRHPVGDFACRPSLSADGTTGISGKAVVALTRIQTQGRGTITIIRTKG